VARKRRVAGKKRDKGWRAGSAGQDRVKSGRARVSHAVTRRAANMEQHAKYHVAPWLGGGPAAVGSGGSIAKRTCA
jgi:hypothetical protein